jgi:endonuclease YncB( thermonuclease family)
MAMSIPLTVHFVLVLAGLAAVAGETFASAVPIELCTGPDRAGRKVTCLVDGDTGWEAGVKWRLFGVDTPEYSANAECPEEPEIAKIATYRMLDLMRGGYEIERLGERDRSGRDLVRIRLSDGRSAGHVLREEGLAVSWPHRPRVWCKTILP